MVIEIPKNEIKEVIRAQIKEEFREAMEKQKRVRLSDYPEWTTPTSKSCPFPSLECVLDTEP